MSNPSRLPAGSTARQQRAERILDTTAELLMAHGYRKVTIDDVAGRAGIGKGTVYLHWKTREALFWAVLQREALRLFEHLLDGLAKDPQLVLPHRLMRTIFLELTQRPLVKALLLNDPTVLGNLAGDETVRSAQQELAENADYLQLLSEQGALRPDLTAKAAGYILVNVTRGFLAAGELGEDEDDELSADQRADLLSDVLRRALEIDAPLPEQALAALNSKVVAMFAAMALGHREQLQRSY
ncbi:TetR/AcrR family transcriptional regulator [Kitasatospora kifunensis]|uniref:AcrR family transcriptional regulator n=1 Tax=Kitasatospora kifunensis TaxID=58351 RepID=A0A7W7R6U9_KITKI|nr:TetR/AcrR family transcriptional regulator [Kitasatospora kifunensis]MBB4926329.1 AcrR family transcriptional regulator [Kitasatospora kifunensis]